jgi:hypothetical protein
MTARREKLADNLLRRFVRKGYMPANLIGEADGFKAKGFRAGDAGRGERGC